MAVHVSHAALPYPVKNARFSVLVQYINSSHVPTDPTTPDTEFSLDGGAFADCAEEVTTISGSHGMALMTFTGAETNGSALAVWFGVASGPAAQLMSLYPRPLPIIESGTAQAGGAGSLTLAANAAAYDLTGYILRTMGGTGGGGTGGANNQARVISAYNTSTKVASISPNWETATDGTTTYDVLLPEGCAAPQDLGAKARTAVNAEVVDVIRTDTVTELVAVPAANAPLHSMLQWLFSKGRNKATETSTTITLRNDADSGNIATSATTDVAGTFTRGKFS